MNYLILTMIAGALVASLVAAPILASAVTDYFTIEKAKVLEGSNNVGAMLKTHGIIPKAGQGGAFGYGILTSEGLNAVMVTTTHKGVKDSALQTDANDARWHNHFVRLDTGVSGLCDDNPEVVNITYQSPGQGAIQGNKVMLRFPSTFTGTDSLSGEPLTLAPGTDVQNVVSFRLDPKFDEGGNLAAVCVEDITPAESIEILS